MHEWSWDFLSRESSFAPSVGLSNIAGLERHYATEKWFSIAPREAQSQSHQDSHLLIHFPVLSDHWKPPPA